MTSAWDSYNINVVQCMYLCVPSINHFDWLVLHGQCILVGSLMLSLFLLFFFSWYNLVFSEDGSNNSAMNTINICKMFVLVRRVNGWIDCWAYEYTVPYSYISIHLFNNLSCLSMHPSLYCLMYPITNIARHLSVLTIYQMEEIDNAF